MDSLRTTFELAFATFPWVFANIIALTFLKAWQRDRDFSREMRVRELEIQERREQEESKRRVVEADRLKEAQDDERHDRWSQERKEEEALLRAQAGAGSGGYIFVDLPDEKRSLFHDLLKGFEEYALLKGYSVSFSVDSTFTAKIAFKFTLTDPDTVVGTDRVRKDLKEYLEKVSKGDSLDDLPQIISVEEHNLVLTTLKNRISFLQYNYNLAKAAESYLMNLIYGVSSQRFLSPNIVVQTGGDYNAPSHSALNSPQAVLGIGNSSTNNSLRIAVTYKERKEQIEQLAEALQRLKQ